MQSCDEQYATLQSAHLKTNGKIQQQREINLGFGIAFLRCSYCWASPQNITFHLGECKAKQIQTEKHLLTFYVNRKEGADKGNKIL